MPTNPTIKQLQIGNNTYDLKALKAANQSQNAAVVRDIQYGTNAPSGGDSGAVYLQYNASGADNLYVYAEDTIGSQQNAADLYYSKNEINNLINNNSPFIGFEAQHTSGSGNITFSGELAFNSIIYDNANGGNASTKRGTCPYKGLYYVSWSYFSNSPKTDGSVRPAIYINGSNRLFASTQPAELNGIFYLDAGHTISAGCYYGTGSLFSSSNHNRFCIALIKTVE